MCRAGDFDLSFESLTGNEARRILRELPTTNPDLFAEVSQSRSQVSVPVLTEEESSLEDSSPETTIEDDSDVPFAKVQAHHNESRNAELSPSSAADPDYIYTANESGGLTSTALSEEVLVESVDGHEADVTPADLTQRRAQRIR
jgi:hypothetical protein